MTKSDNPSVLYVIGCDDIDTAKLQLTSCQAHSLDDALGLSLRKQNKVMELFFQSLLHNEVRILKTLFLCSFYIFFPLTFLFQIVYSVFCFLGTAFLLLLKQCQMGLFYTHLCKKLDTFYTYLSDRQPFVYGVKTRIKVLFRDTSDILFPCETPFLRRWSLN